MRIWIFKTFGVVLWSLFLFVPFLARADKGFDVTLPMETSRIDSRDASVIFTFGDFELQFDNQNKLKVPVEDKWSVKLNAGKDTVLTRDLPADVRHDRLPLDDGERESFRFGIDLNYQF